MSKTLLIAAAALAGSVISSQAQVYSQNIVGYINVPLVTGYTAVANQLDYDGTGTNNTVATVFGTNLVSGSIAEAWSPTSLTFISANWTKTKTGLSWLGATNAINEALNTGSGVFFYSPATNNVTLVGTVLQGTNSIALVKGYNLVSSVAPISGGVSTTLGYAPVSGDQVELWSVSAQQYVSYNYTKTKTGVSWLPQEPQVAVAQPFFIVTGAAETWTNVFTSN